MWCSGRAQGQTHAVPLRLHREALLWLPLQRCLLASPFLIATLASVSPSSLGPSGWAQPQQAEPWASRGLYSVSIFRARLGYSCPAQPARLLAGVHSAEGVLALPYQGPHPHWPSGCGSLEALGALGASIGTCNLQEGGQPSLGHAGIG